MLFRESAGVTIAITQPSHAWLSGQIMRAWGNAEFGAVTPYEDVCLGAEQHDIGWLVWEQSPTLNKVAGRPHSFRELSAAVHTEIWSRGTEMALALGRYPALLVSLHGTGLYANFDSADAGPADRDAVRDFLRAQETLQSQLIESLSGDPRLGEYSSGDMVERNRRLVRAADRMSIAICTGMRDVAIRADGAFNAVVKDVPTASGETDVRLSAVDGDITKVAVTPWPFTAATVRVDCEGILLPSGSFDDEMKMRTALRNAKKLALSTELRPGS